MSIFQRSISIEAPAQEVFAWHARPGALARLDPPWDPVRILEQTGGVADRGRVKVQVNVGPLRFNWFAQHTDYEPGHMFKDIAIGGPFARWEHTHIVEPDGPGHSVLTDHIEYELPLGPAGRLLGSGFVERKLNTVFRFRHQQTRMDIQEHERHRAAPRRTIAITGASGMIGQALCPMLTTGGHRVIRLVRGRKSTANDEAWWDPTTGECELEKLEGVDAVVHLGAENLAAGRWTAARKARIRESRVSPTRRLCEMMLKLKSAPRAFLCASAIGFYGSRADEAVDESSPAGKGFLADVCREWEDAASLATAAAKIRVVNLRFGVVLSPRGGALLKMLPAFKFGLGGVMGNGTQYWSWVSLDDAAGLIHHSIMEEAVRGPLNAVSPQALTNHDFTKALGRVLHRPTVMPLPEPILRLALGEMADEALLASQRVVPTRAQLTGYVFRDPELVSALSRMLGKKVPDVRPEVQ